MLKGQKKADLILEMRSATVFKGGFWYFPLIPTPPWATKNGHL